MFALAPFLESNVPRGLSGGFWLGALEFYFKLTVYGLEYGEFEDFAMQHLSSGHRASTYPSLEKLGAE